LNWDACNRMQYRTQYTEECVTVQRYESKDFKALKVSSMTADI